MFDWGKEKKLEGAIDKFQWTQPHTFIWVKVPGKAGKEAQFGLEGMSPSWLGRHEWSSRSLQVGQKVDIDYYPLRDGRPGRVLRPREDARRQGARRRCPAARAAARRRPPPPAAK